jgi:ribosomal protein S7
LKEDLKSTAFNIAQLETKLEQNQKKAERDALTLLTIALKQLTPRERVLEHERGQIYLQCDCSRMDAAVGE